MDFTFTDDQQTIGDVARTLFESRCAPDRLTEIEAGPIRHDAALWKELASSDLLGIALPEAVGGSGRGFLELGLLLREVGWAVAPVPIYSTLLLGADPIARYGTDEQQARLLPGVIDGSTVLTAGLMEPGRSDPAAPTTTARRDGSGWKLYGSKELVPSAQIAHSILISAATEDGEHAVFVVESTAAGVEIAPVEVSGGQPHADVTLDGVEVSTADRLGDAGQGAEIIQSIYDRALVGLCATQLGVAERALRIAAKYTAEREQFGRPIGSFQAVQQRMADAFIDVEAMRWTTWHAAWLASDGRPFGREARMAKFWAAEAGMRVVATAQQVHGGIGIDVTYPLSRYFVWAQHNELALGPATAQLARLGTAYLEGAH